MTALRLGTRRSRLATTQSTHVAELLRARGHEVELVEIVTEGDRSNAPLEEIGGTGVFASSTFVWNSSAVLITSAMISS